MSFNAITSPPAFLNNLYAKSGPLPVYSSYVIPSYSEVVLGDALVDAGVIFVGAAGNDNQKMVLKGHPDYNNYEINKNFIENLKLQFPKWQMKEGDEDFTVMRIKISGKESTLNLTIEVTT